MTGHLLGAAGAVEAICCIQAINESFIPVINFENADPECDLNYTFNKSTNKKNYAVSNTFGFGGHNASLVLKNMNEVEKFIGYKFKNKKLLSVSYTQICNPQTNYENLNSLGLIINFT